MKFLRWLLAPLSLLVTTWCGLALVYAPHGPSLWTMGLAGLYVVCVAVIFWRNRNPGFRLAALVTAWTPVLLWFLLVPAPAQANWISESQVAPRLEIIGDQVTVQGIRDFRWRSKTDFDAQWIDRTYSLAHLRTVDFFLSFWGPKRICHTFVSFGFERPDQTMDQLAVSIEVRKQKGQSYSALGSAFRQFSLIYIWATETDVIRVRTNFRGEQVYRYRVRLSPEMLQHIFRRYVAESQRLYEHPRWYNAVTDSCGVDILRTVWGNRVGIFPTFEQLFNGLWEQHAYDQGRLDRSVPFEKLRERANISPAAQQSTPENFSTVIRHNTVWLEVAPP